jgi:hypothetical protein
LTARDSVFTGNGSSFFYAAIYSEHLSMTRCTISWNIAPDNGGGVACNSGDLTACTISSNSCVGNGGGVLHGTGNLTMTQCTVVGNEAFYLGGGICSSGTIRITSCTIQGNDAGEEGGGIHVAPSGQLILENSIVAGNRSFIDGPDILGSIQTEAGVNLLGSTSGLTGSFSGIVGEPDLMPLADYGGPTFTMLPTPGSPVIDAGGPTALTTDQRGLPRVVAALDIGAVEVQPPLVVTNTGDGTPGSLRDLLSTAPNGSTITFDPSLDGSEIRVGSLVEDMPLVIDTNVVIDATGLERLVLRPAGHTSLLRVKVGSVAWIGGLDFEGSWGTAIRNAGDLTLDDCKMVDNTLTNEGGALFNATGAVVRLKACLLSGNRSYGEGGAAFNEGTMWIHDSVLADNECDTEGGAVFSSGRLEVEDSVFVGNGSYDTGGAVFSTGTLTMARSTAEDNWAGDNGGAIHTSGGAADLSACTLSGNKCFEGEGAGIYQGGGSLTLSQCTITGNLADLGFGGGVSSRGEIRVVSCTIADNTAFFEVGRTDPGEHDRRRQLGTGRAGYLGCDHLPGRCQPALQHQRIERCFRRDRRRPTARRTAAQWRSDLDHAAFGRIASDQCRRDDTVRCRSAWSRAGSRRDGRHRGGRDRQRHPVGGDRGHHRRRGQRRECRQCVAAGRDEGCPGRFDRVLRSVAQRRHDQLDGWLARLRQEHDHRRDFAVRRGDRHRQCDPRL